MWPLKTLSANPFERPGAGASTEPTQGARAAKRENSPNKLASALVTAVTLLAVTATLFSAWCLAAYVFAEFDAYADALAAGSRRRRRCL